MWWWIAIAIESMALIGVVSILATRRTFLAFVVGFNTMALVTGIYVWHGGLHPRAILVLAMVALYLLRMNWVLFAWTGQTALGKIDEKTPLAPKLMLPVVLANTAGWAYCLPFYFASRNADPLGVIDFVAIAVYLIGTIFHFGSDYQKRRFKLRDDTRRKLLDTGFWSLCRHPNYFGDFLIYVSFAVVGGAPWGWIAPALNLLQYACDAIPKSEQWAAERYAADWEAYRARTRIFIPFVI